METSQVDLMVAMQLCIQEIEKIKNVNDPMKESYDKVWETYLEETKDETIFNLSDEQWKDKFGELPKEYYTREDTKNKLFKEYANLHYKLLGVKIELSPITIYYETKDAFKNKKLITA